MTLGIGFGGWEEVVKVFHWLTCFHGLLNSCVSRECLLVLGTGIAGRVWGRKLGGDLWDPLGMGSESKRRPQQIFCCRAGGDTGGAAGEVCDSLQPTCCP